MAYLSSYQNNQKEYYDGSDLGNYQFCSLDDIINQFMFVYVGDEKLINNVSRTDVTFFAQRALSELSFDTFKSVKSQQIQLPPSLTMMLPHDYVNYTHVSRVDSSGIKHPIYLTNSTSNPFQIRQHDDGTYDFPEQHQLLQNEAFDLYDGILHNPWSQSSNTVTSTASWVGAAGTKFAAYNTAAYSDGVKVEGGILTFRHGPQVAAGIAHGTGCAVWQQIDVSDIDYVDVSAFAETTAALAGNTAATSGVTNAAGNQVSSLPYWTVASGTGSGNVGGGNATPYTGNFFAADSGTSNAGNAFGNTIPNAGVAVAANIPATTIRVGLSTSPGDNKKNLPPYHLPGNNGSTGIFNIGYLEWTSGEAGVKESAQMDVRQYDSVYLLVTSSAPWDNANWGNSPEELFVKSFVDNISVMNSYSATSLQERSTKAGVSSTWENYKASTPSESNNDNYEDDTYWPVQGERYGLEPSHAHINGSFYIDDLRGKIHFSSNLSGKDVILDYISDSLGTADEMKVHKFAEEAMYKWILHGVLASRINSPEHIIRRIKKEKFAATRNAKLRLSSLKTNEITQALRDRSKWIKH